VIEYSYLGNFTTTVSSIINITNGVYSGTFNGIVRTLSSASITLLKKNFNIVYTPNTISASNIQFYNDTTYIYKGSELYYYITFYPVQNIPNNGFIRLQLGSYGNFGVNPFCTSSTLSPYVP
jgi:hypothetical protein